MATKTVMIMVYLRTFFEFLIVILAMIVFMPLGVLAFLIHIIGLKKLSAIFIYKMAQCWAMLLIIGSGCTMKVTGRENIPKTGGVCFVSNHTGLLDIPLLLAYTGRPFGFIAKKELSFIPFLNMWILLLGGLFIDRKNPRKALKTISKGVKHIKSGSAMIIFPEGHRSRGQGLLPFRPGAFKLAVRSGAALIPVSISGGYEVFEKQRAITPGPVSITFGAPVFASEFENIDAKQNLSDKIYGIIDEMLKKQ